MPLNTPFENPYFITACFVYSEQLGEKRQAQGRIALMYRWYMFSRIIAVRFNIKYLVFFYLFDVDDTKPSCLFL
jgi:hypothetical protein